MRAIFPFLTVLCMMQAACGENPPQVASAPSATPLSSAAAMTMFKAIDKQAEPLVEKLDGGEINWTTGEAFAVGQSPAQGGGAQHIEMAKRAARLVAARNGTLVLAGIRTGPGGRFKNFREGVIGVDAVLRDFKEASSEFDPKTHLATVRLAIPMYGVDGVVKLVGLTPVPSGEAVKPAQSKPGPARIIVIDARGTGFKPCMLPRIASSSGRSVFDASRTTDAPKPDHSPVLYVSMTRHDELIPTAPGKYLPAGEEGPVVIYHAQKSPDKSPGSLVLGDDDASDMMNYLASGGIMSAGRVVVVSDPPTPPPATAPTPASAPANTTAPAAQNSRLVP